MVLLSVYIVEVMKSFGVLVGALLVLWTGGSCQGIAKVKIITEILAFYKYATRSFLWQL